MYRSFSDTLFAAASRSFTGDTVKYENDEDEEWSCDMVDIARMLCGGVTIVVVTGTARGYAAAAEGAPGVFGAVADKTDVSVVDEIFPELRTGSLCFHLELG